MILLENTGRLFEKVVSVFDGPGMLLVALLDSSFLSIPEGNDLLIVILSINKPWERVAYYVLMTTIGSVIGCLFLYMAGRKGGNALLRKRFSASGVNRAERIYRRFGIFAVFVPSILPPPCPFKVFVLSAGVFQMNLPSFLLTVAAGRTMRYSMWGILSLVYGDPLQSFMAENLLTLGFVLLTLLAVCLVVMIIRLRRAGDTALQLN